MRRRYPIRVILALLLAGPRPRPPPPAAPRTMRVDYFHTGNATEERFSLDRVVLEPLPWPGNPARPIDDTNLGKYFFEVIDRGTNRVALLARLRLDLRRVGDDRTRRRRCAAPSPSRCASRRRPARCRSSLKKRDAQNAFREIWSLLVDPEGHVRRHVRAAVAGAAPRDPEAGDPADKVDFLILGDGYTAAERGKFEKDARRLTELLFAVAPFKERRGDFNVWALCPPAEESGISRPSTGIHRRSPRRRDLRRVRLRALHPDLREPRPSATSPRSRPTSSSRS